MYHEIALPEGDVQGFDIDYSAGTGRTKYASAVWLDQGYAGVVFRGKGRDKTHIRPVGDQAILVGRHDGIVTLQDLTVHCGSRQGIWFGLANKANPVDPNFRLRLRNVRIVADPPAPSSLDRHTTVWGVFSYQADLDFDDVEFDLRYSAEHASYAHHFARAGLLWKRVRVIACGAEGCKVRNEPDEGVKVPGAKIVVQHCSFADWNQPWSWRGGAGMTVQGGGYDVYVDQCRFKAPSTTPGHAHSLMIDDGGGRFYSAKGGGVGEGFANGYVVVTNSGFHGGVGSDNYTPIIRAGNFLQNQPWKVAKGLLVRNCGAWGEHVQVQMSDLPQGKVSITGCNTPWLSEWARVHNIDTSHEAVVTLRDRIKPLSEGHSA